MSTRHEIATIQDVRWPNPLLRCEVEVGQDFPLPQMKPLRVKRENFNCHQLLFGETAIGNVLLGVGDSVKIIVDLDRRLPETTQTAIIERLRPFVMMLAEECNKVDVLVEEIEQEMLGVIGRPDKGIRTQEAYSGPGNDFESLLYAGTIRRLLGDEFYATKDPTGYGPTQYRFFYSRDGVNLPAFCVGKSGMNVYVKGTGNREKARLNFVSTLLAEAGERMRAIASNDEFKADSASLKETLPSSVKDFLEQSTFTRFFPYKSFPLQLNTEEQTVMEMDLGHSFTARAFNAKTSRPSTLNSTQPHLEVCYKGEVIVDSISGLNPVFDVKVLMPALSLTIIRMSEAQIPVPHYFYSLERDVKAALGTNQGLLKEQRIAREMENIVEYFS